MDVGGGGSMEGLMSLSLLFTSGASVRSMSFDGRRFVLRRVPSDFPPFVDLGRHCGRRVEAEGYF